MAAQTDKIVAGARAHATNEVHLTGRVAADPAHRVLPSGDVLWSLRLIVDRGPSESRSRQRADTIECAVWSARLQRSVSRWAAGDQVEIHGAVRRRFFRTGTGVASRVEVEVARGRIIRRSAT